MKPEHILLVALLGILGLVALVHHELRKGWNNHVVGPSLQSYSKKEHKSALPVKRPKNLSPNRKGYVRAAAENGSTQSFMQVRGWRMRYTLGILALAGLGIAVLLWMNGAI